MNSLSYNADLPGKRWLASTIESWFLEGNQAAPWLDVRPALQEEIHAWYYSSSPKFVTSEVLGSAGLPNTAQIKLKASVFFLNRCFHFHGQRPLTSQIKETPFQWTITTVPKTHCYARCWRWMMGRGSRNASFYVWHRHDNHELSAVVSIGTRASQVRHTYMDKVGAHGAPQILGEEEEQYTVVYPLVSLLDSTGWF